MKTSIGIQLRDKSFATPEILNPILDVHTAEVLLKKVK